MTVLVTGGTGFIGNHVVRMCLEQGDDVRVMVMPGEDRSPLDGLDVEFVEADLTDAASLRAPVKGIERIYHLAAIYAIWLKDPALMYRVNVEGARTLLRNAMDEGVQKVVFTSSIAAKGVNNDGSPATEETGFNQWEFGNDYVLSKYISEQEVRALIAQGLPAVIVNPAFPFGPGDRMPTPTGKILLNVLRGEMPGYLPGGINAVDVRDVARGHLLAMEKGEVGRGYLLANKDGNVTFREFIRIVKRVAGIEGGKERRLSVKMIARAAKVMEAVADLRGKPPMITYKTAMYTTQNLFYDPSRAITELGLPQTPIEVSVEEAVAWFRKNGYA